jgi:hypothetical protein
MRFKTLLIIFGFFLGCSSTPWKDVGEQGPWCAPSTRARVFCRTVNQFMASNEQGQAAYASSSGIKRSSVSFGQELDSFFVKSTFIDQWPDSNFFVNSIRQHLSPYDLCLVSMSPTVIVGVEKDRKESSLNSTYAKKHHFIGSTFLVDSIEVRTTLPYHFGARVVWFSPASGYDLHQLDLETGTASFAISEKEQIKVTVEGTELMTLRK